MMYRYDVALSFAAEMEETVRKVNWYMEAEGLNTFFFSERQKELLSQNPYKSIYKVFQSESLVKVLFVTLGYYESEWTGIERRRALDSTKEDSRRLIVVNYIDKKLDRELKTYIFAEGNKLEADEIASYIISRVKEIKNERQIMKKEESTTNIIVQNKGIITGDNAVFHNIQF